MTEHQITRRLLKPAVFVAASAPAAILIYLTWAAFHGEPSAWPALTGNLSANPLEDLTHRTGLWALRFLCLTLAMTPLRQLTGWSGAIRFRRMLGLFAFFYGTLHFLTYAILDRFMSLEVADMASWTSWRALFGWIASDIAERPFITAGFVSFVAMLPLAATSTAGMIRRLGGRRWQMLHRLVYVAAIAGVIHFWWLVKLDVSRPAFYGLIVAALLGFRIVRARWRARAIDSPAVLPSRVPGGGARGDVPPK